MSRNSMFARGVVAKMLLRGGQSTYAKVQPNKALTLKGENLIHVICKNCGTVVRSYIENPQVLE